MPATPRAASVPPPADSTPADEPEAPPADGTPSPRPSRRGAGTRWRRRLATSLAAAASLATVVSLAITLFPGDDARQDARQTASAKAAGASGGHLRSSIAVGTKATEKTGRCEIVYGQLTGAAPEGMDIGVVVEVNHRFYPQSRIHFPQHERLWAVPTYLGRAKSSENDLGFTIKLVMVPADKTTDWGTTTAIGALDEPSWTVLAETSVVRRTEAEHCPAT